MCLPTVVPLAGGRGAAAATAVPSSADVDECAVEPPPCEDQQYCENVNGSFVCQGERASRPAAPAPPSPPEACGLSA